jgi:deoxyadenosine/deoxycytidine kinase
MSTPCRYIVVSGNTGAGKSTLLKGIGAALRSRGVEHVETYDERLFHHPLLMRMFDDPLRWALPIQLNFMTQRAARLLDALQVCAPGTVVLMERCLWEDKYFFDYYVRRGAIPAEIRPHYLGVLEGLINITPVPILVVHLKASVPTLFGRLERAMRLKERDVELEGERLYNYIEAMNDLYRDWPSEISRVTDLLEYDLDAEGYDPAAVVERICSVVMDAADAGRKLGRDQSPTSTSIGDLL